MSLSSARNRRVDADLMVSNGVLEQSQGVIRGGLRRAWTNPLHVCMFLTAAFVLAAVLPWWNRCFGVTNYGWHYFFGRQILAGEVPYRDFYMFVPPLYALKNALVIALFGDRIIFMHVVAIIEIVVLVIVLIAWISKSLPIFESSVGVTTAMALYILIKTAEPLGGLDQEAVFFPILAGWVASLVLRNAKAVLVLLTGVLAGLALMAKQTSGVATLVGLGVLLPALICYRDGKKPALSALLWYMLGAAFPVGALCAWLGATGALSSFVSQVFLKGSSSKGPRSDAILRPVLMVVHDRYFGFEFLLAAICLCILFFVIQRSPRIGENHLSQVQVGLFYCAAFMSIVVGVMLSRVFDIQYPRPWLQYLPTNFMLFFGEIGCFVLFFVHAKALLCSPESSERDLQLLLLTGFGAGLAYLDAASWAVKPSMVLPSLAVTLSYVLSRLCGTRQLRRIRAAVLVLCVLSIAQFCVLRMNAPFRWGGWSEPNVRYSHQELSYPQLAGFRVSAESAEVINRIVEDILANSKPGDPILAYPDIPIFYILSNRTPATFAYIHFVDVTPDFVDRADAETIVRTPPAVIVYWDMTEQELRDGEIYFRHGNRSGLRDFVAAFNELKPRYRTIDTFRTGTGDKFVVMARVAE